MLAGSSQVLKTGATPEGEVAGELEGVGSPRTLWSRDTSRAFNYLGLAFMWENKSLLF